MGDMLVILTQLDMGVLLVLDIHMERDLLMLKLMPRFLPPHTLLDMLDTHTLLDMLDILMLLDMLVILMLLDMLVILTQLDMLEVAETTLEPLFLANYPQTCLKCP